MATFGTPPTVINLDDPTQGGLKPAGASSAAPTVQDKSFGDPAADAFFSQQRQYAQQAKVLKTASSVKTQNAQFEKDAVPSFMDIAKATPAALGDIVMHPGDALFGGAYGVSKGFMQLADLPVRAINGLSSLVGGKQLPLAGQTFMDWVDSATNPSDVTKSLEAVTSQLPGYEVGGAAVRGLGVTGAASKIIGNVAGGQIANQSPITDVGDRAKQAMFDAAFGTLDVAGNAAAKAFSGGKVQAAVDGAKNSVMSNAISTFEKPDSPAFNPEVAKNLREYLGSKDFTNAKTVVDFEKGLQAKMGDSFYDPKVNTVLQPIIDSGHAQVGQALGVKPQTATGPIKPMDAFDPETLAAKAEAAKDLKAPETKYQTKDLGKDPAGNKIMANTMVDAKTGNALVLMSKELAALPKEQQAYILDHEHGHILQRRLNMSDPTPPTDPKEAISTMLDRIAKDNGQNPHEFSAALAHDVEMLTGDKSGSAEAFADAHAMYKANPEEASRLAPTFSKVVNSEVQAGRFSEHNTTLESLKQDSPIAGNELEKALKENKAKIKTEPTSKPAKSAGGKIASTGLDTGSRVEGKLSFNPDKINAPDDVEKLFNKMDAENATFSKQRMAKDNEQIKDLARLTGLKEEELIKARPGSIANAETLTAARQLVVNKAQTLADLLKGTDLETAPAAKIQEIKAAYAHLVAMQQSVAGLRTEAANTLRSLQIKVGPEENFALKDIFTKMKAANLAADGDAALFAGKVAKDLQRSMGAKIATGAMETWYASILSGPGTYIHHGLGVNFNGVTDMVSKIGNPALWKEFVPQFKGLLTGLGNAGGKIKETWLAEGKDASFTETGRQPVFSGGSKAANIANKAIEMTGRNMTALAAGYKEIYRSVEDASLKVYAPEMSEEVTKALSDAYTNNINLLDNPKGYISGKLFKGIKAMTQGAYNPLKLIVPFNRVVTNILDTQMKFLPGPSVIRAFDIDGGLTESTTQIMKDAGLEGEANRIAIFKRLKDQQIGRMVTGMGLSVGAFAAAAQGNVSGSGPSTYDAKIQLERTGWRPNSIKIGDTWIPYLYLGPMAGIFSMAGNIHDAKAYDKNMADGDYTAQISKGLLGFGQSELNQSFLKSVSDLLGAVSDPTKGATYLKNFGAGLIPVPKAITGTRSIVNAALGDEYQYKTNSIVDKIRVELGLTGSIADMPALEPSQNQFGEPLKADMIYGVSPSFSHADAVDAFLAANDIVITIPSANQKYTDPATGDKRSLTSEEYSAYMKAAGSDIYTNLQQMIPSLQGEDIDTQRNEIRAMLDQVRTDNRTNIMSQ